MNINFLFTNKVFFVNFINQRIYIFVFVCWVFICYVYMNFSFTFLILCLLLNNYFNIINIYTCLEIKLFLIYVNNVASVPRRNLSTIIQKIYITRKIYRY